MTLMTDAVTTAPDQPRTTASPRPLPPSRSSIVGLRPVWTGPVANPRRIRLTAPGNPVHR